MSFERALAWQMAVAACLLLSLVLPAAAAPNLAVFKACASSYLKTSKSRMTLVYSGANTPLYQKLSQRIFNTRFWWQKPSVVALPTSDKDVSALVRCGNKAALRYVARCGGHNYDGMSSVHLGMVIDMSSINAITVDKHAKRATIGAGQRLGPVYRALYERGGFMIPGGTCVAVGVSGLTSGGGIGASTRKLGLTIDWLQSATIVAPNGTILTASATSNPDLFFAIRGGGGNFGIITSWTFRLARAPSAVTVLEASWPGSKAVDVVKAISSWKAWALPEAYSQIEWFWASDISTSIYYWGPKSKVEPLLKTGPFKAVPSYKITFFQHLSYANFVLHYTNFYAEPNWTFQSKFTTAAVVARQWGPGAVPAAAATGFKGVSVMLAKDLPDKAISALSQAIASTSKGWVQARALLGAAGRVPASATAYPHRNATWEVQIYSNVAGDADVQWVQTTKKALKPYGTGHEYVNYPDCADTKDPWKTYFAGNAARLQAIKKKYDPANRLDTLHCH